jgi:hypothetical protein
MKSGERGGQALGPERKEQYGKENFFQLRVPERTILLDQTVRKSC